LQIYQHALLVCGSVILIRYRDELLFSERRTGGSLRWNRLCEGVVWEDRLSPSLTSPYIGDGNDVSSGPPFPPAQMHEARHTAITDFLRSSGNLKLAQQFARHASIQTTADVYAT
jgi:integrase